MRVTTPFDPIEVGETDIFVFDFTADAGPAQITSTDWTCALAPYQTAIDPLPQSRVVSVSAQTAILVRSPMDGSLQTRVGLFSIAAFGGMAVLAVVVTYVSVANSSLRSVRVDIF